MLGTNEDAMNAAKHLSKTAVTLLLTGPALVIAFAAAPASAQNAVAYTDGQAQAGQGVYHQFCESCHGDNLQGLLEAPPLSGPRFASWKGMKVRDLYDFIQSFMPQDKPGSLSKKQYADLTAYILKFNSIAPGAAAELPEDPPATMVIPK